MGPSGRLTVKLSAPPIQPRVLVDVIRTASRKSMSSVGGANPRPGWIACNLDHGTKVTRYLSACLESLVPFTPFHMRPGCALKAVAGNSFWPTLANRFAVG